MSNTRSKEHVTVSWSIMDPGIAFICIYPLYIFMYHYWVPWRLVWKAGRSGSLHRSRRCSSQQKHLLWHLDLLSERRWAEVLLQALHAITVYDSHYRASFSCLGKAFEILRWIEFPLLGPAAGAFPCCLFAWSCLECLPGCLKTTSARVVMSETKIDQHLLASAVLRPIFYLMFGKKGSAATLFLHERCMQWCNALTWIICRIW